MPPWLGTGIVLVAVAAIVGMIIFAQIRARKQGKSGCGCGCEHCAMQCHKKREDQKEE